MKILHRCDGGAQIGMGHIMRSTALATELRQRGHSVSFLVKELDGVASEYVRSKGFSVLVIPDSTNSAEQARYIIDCDFVIVDSYMVDEQFFAILSERQQKVLAMLDYAPPFFIDVDCILLPYVIPAGFKINAASRAV